MMMVFTYGVKPLGLMEAENILSNCQYFKIKIYKTIILLVVLYGSETWPLTLRDID
jgi:hypothetical protein